MILDLLEESGVSDLPASIEIVARASDPLIAANSAANGRLLPGRHPVAAGCRYELKRQGRGDHEIWWNPRTNINVTVDPKLRSRFTANGILKEANLPKAF